MRRLPEKHAIRPNYKKTESVGISDSNISHLVLKLRNLYFLGAEMFDSAFILQIPSVSLHYDKKDTATLFNNKSNEVNGINGREFKDKMHWSPNGFDFQSDASPKRKKVKAERYNMQQLKKPMSEWFTPNGKLILKRSTNLCTINQAFECHGIITPVKNRKIYMCIRGCSTKNFDFLKQRKWTLPEVQSHPYRNLLTKQNRKTIIGRMPHWTFIKPNFPPDRPSYSLMYQIL